MGVPRRILRTQHKAVQGRRSPIIKACLCLPVIVVAMAFSGAALGGSKTTGPGQEASILVTITDKGISLNSQNPHGPGEEARGTIAVFATINKGKKEHNFTIFGKKTPMLKPLERAKITVTLLYRGRFPFRSTVDKGKGFHGIFVVY